MNVGQTVEHMSDEPVEADRMLVPPVSELVAAGVDVSAYG